ncbi:MAG TPA: hypothetical protein VMF57_00650 [Solirubrobacteraceae bacterium]|nr:hypothetical protein [Solirubrobacteraceae bacterium]
MVSQITNNRELRHHPNEVTAGDRVRPSSRRLLLRYSLESGQDLHNTTRDALRRRRDVLRMPRMQYTTRPAPGGPSEELCMIGSDHMEVVVRSG